MLSIREIDGGDLLIFWGMERGNGNNNKSPQ
jgi:hypothetical protein